MTPERKAEPTPAQLDIYDTISALWAEPGWTPAQQTWLRRQVLLPEERRQRAINSVMERAAIAAGGQR